MQNNIQTCDNLCTELGPPVGGLVLAYWFLEALFIALCFALKSCFVLEALLHRKKGINDPARFRTWNPLIRSQMPYQLGHGACVSSGRRIEWCIIQGRVGNWDSV